MTESAPQVATTWQHYEKYVIIDTVGEARIVSGMPKTTSLKSNETVYCLKWSVPRSRVPIPAGTFVIKLPALENSNIEVTIDDTPVKLGTPTPHMFVAADLNETLCRRCGSSPRNLAHRCVAPECHQPVSVERDGIPYCAQHDPLEEDRNEQ